MTFACLLSPSLIPFRYTGAGECHRNNVSLCAISLRRGKVAWELSGLRGTSERGPRGQPRWQGCCREPRRTGSAWAVGPAPYCLHVAIFAFCCNRDEQWIQQRPTASLQNHSILSAAEIAEQKTMCGNCGYRKWSATTAFTFRLF